jgi:translation elongation factor EF-1alpha
MSTIPRYFSLIGQVDVGKSTLAGRFIHKCGLIEEHEFEKHKKNCQGSMYAFWSRFLDIYTEEQARSKTFEYTTIQLEVDEHKYVLIGTPDINLLFDQQIRYA